MKKVIVIGSGPGGYVAAIRLAQLGNLVTIIEKDNIGGCCLNVGCIPSKALIRMGHLNKERKVMESFGYSFKDTTIDFKKAQAWKDKDVVQKLTGGIEALLKKNKVEIVRGSATFVTKNKIEVDGKTIEFTDAVIATGSSPIIIPGFELGKGVYDSTGILNLKEVPKSLVVIGGGYIGCELANAYANLGTEVTILEGTGSILPGFDKDMVKVVEREFKKENLKVVVNALAKSFNKPILTYEKKGKQETIETDHVLISVGRKPNTQNLNLEKIGIKVNKNGLIEVNSLGQTSQPNIYAIGDIIAGPALAHKASYEAKIVAENISGKKYTFDYRAIPSVCFVDPELASTGVSLQEAKDSNYKISEFPLQANGRALTIDETQGFVRLISDPKTEVLLGAQIVGPNAGELIAQCTLAIENELNLEDIALTIHPHPSVSESIMDTAEVGLGSPIHV